jgi:hypothetical protein
MCVAVKSIKRKKNVRRRHRQGRPPAMCQVQGRAEEHYDYDFLIKYFKSDPDLRKAILNLLDNPGEGDPALAAGIEVPDAIETRDVIDFGIERPADPDQLRWGVKIPSYWRWLVVSSKYSVTGFHRDSKGFWTLLAPQKGIKYLFLVPPNEHNLKYLEKHSQYLCISELTNVISVPIGPGDVFGMCPGTIHGAVTEEDSIVVGMHFLLRETLDLSLRLAKEDIEHLNLTNEPDAEGRNLYLQLLKVLPLSKRC